MARKSRANISQTSMVRKSRKIWYVGLYIRLSKEDEHPLKHDDSESVKNQEKILRAHFAAMDDGDTYEIVKVFIDDGIWITAICGRIMTIRCRSLHRLSKR